MKNKSITVMLCVLLLFTLAACDNVSPACGAPPENSYELTEPNETDRNESEPNEQTPELPQVSEPPAEQEVPTVSPPVDLPIIPATDDLIVSTANGLNIRAGAGTNYKSIGTLDSGDMAMPVRKVGSWYEILYKNTVGYVSSSYVNSVSFALGSDKVEKVIDEGKKLLGFPYVFGAQRYHWGNGVRNTNYDGLSYDCSSLMQYIFKIGANVNLAMTSREQSVQGTAVAKDKIRRGDLLFFTNASRVNKTGIERIGHVALYLGDNIILHTASDHAVIEPISNTRWGYYVCARRVI